MGSDDVKDLMKYLKALLFEVKMKEKIPEKYAKNKEFLEIDATLKTIRESVGSFGKGDLLVGIKGKGFIIGALKNLQASLKNLTWQTKVIASGDFSQKVEFLGEFSAAFNSMTQKLEDSTQDVKQTKEYFEMLFQTIPDPTVITSIEKGIIYGYNKAFLDKMGYSNEEMEDNVVNVLHLYNDAEQRDRLIAQLRKNGVCQNEEIVFCNRRKEQIIGLISSKVISIKGEIYILSVIRDITHLKEVEKQLRESEERHRLLADNASDVIWTMDLEGKFTYISPSVEKLRGYTVEEVLKQSQEEVLCADSLVYMQQGLDQVINLVQKNQHFPVFRGELEQPCKNGGSVWTEASISGIYNDSDKFMGMIGVSRDISERKKMEQEILRLSITDNLTQIYNRLRLDEALENEMARVNRSKGSFSIILLDIDHFKSVNDTFGHQVGDNVLKEFANILKKNVRSIDTLGRWGGEEFLIILPETDKIGGIRLAEKLRAAVDLNNYIKVGNITASFGVAEYNGDSSSANIVSRADQAMYKAKENGRNCIEFL